MTRMLSTAAVAMLLLAGLAPALLPGTGSQAAVTGLSLAMPGDVTHTDILGDIQMTSGVLYYLNFTLSAPSDNVTVRLTYTGAFASANNTNTYRVSYLPARTPQFRDDLYGKYLQAGKCSAASDSYTFAFGVHANIRTGRWALEILSDGASVHNATVKLAKGIVGISLSAPTFTFILKPFNASVEVKSKPSAFTVGNMGNIIAQMTVRFDQFSPYLTVTNTTGTLATLAQRKCEVVLNAPELFPQRKVFKGTVELACTHFITADMVNFIPKVSADIDVVIEVRRATYDILDLGTAAIQYQRILSTKYGDQLTTDVYVTGTGQVTLDVTTLSLRAPTATRDGASVQGTSFNLDLDALETGEEYHFVFVSRATKADTVAYLNYTLDTGAVSGTASTKVYVRANPTILSVTEGGLTGGWIAAIVIVLLVAAGVGFVVWQARQGAAEPAKPAGAEPVKPAESPAEPAQQETESASGAQQGKSSPESGEGGK